MPTTRSRRFTRPRAPQINVPAPVPGPTFPASILNVTAEILLGGTWTDISSLVYQRDPMVIFRGKPDWTQSIQAATMTLTINNQDGSFSPRNVNGQFYPNLTRNTQIRLSVDASSVTGVAYSGYRFWGEVPVWPSRWDITGTDIYVPIVAAGLIHRYAQGAPIGSSLHRYYSLLSSPYAPIAYWPCEDAVNSTTISSVVSGGFDMTWSGTPNLVSNTDFVCSDALPLFNGSVFSGLTGSFSPGPGDDIFTTPGLHSWVATTTSVTVTGTGPGGGGNNGNNGYAGGGGEWGQQTMPVTPGSTYPVYVGKGGQGGQLRNDGSNSPGQDGDDSYFTGDAGTVKFHGGDGGTGAGPGGGGNGSGAPLSHPGGFGGGRAHGDQAGGGGGGSGGPSANGNIGGNTNGNTGGAGAAAVAGGGRGGRGADAPGDANGHAGYFPGGGGGAGAHDPNSGAAHGGKPGAGGRMELTYTPVSAPDRVTIRFLVGIPSGGAQNGTILLRFLGSSTIDHGEVYYGTGGKIGLRAYNAASATLFDTGLVSYSADGALLMISAELAQVGANISYILRAATIGATSVSISTATSGSFAGSMGAVTQVLCNVNGLGTDIAIGHITVQYAYIPLSDASLIQALIAHNSELAGTRFLRLCAEQGVTGTIRGLTSDTPAMGPQLDGKFVDLLQECEDADLGMIIEPRDFFGLSYRTRVNLQNQIPDVMLDYSMYQLSGDLEPTDDDQLVRNDVTVGRNNGGSTRLTLSSGPLSTLDPPNGVGSYTYTANVNLSTDGQTVNMASWVLSLGTLDKTRYPVIQVDLSRPELAALFSIVPLLDFGDYMQVQNLPSWLPEPLIKMLLYGVHETIQVTGPWEFDWNTVPEDVYEGSALLTW